MEGTIQRNYIDANRSGLSNTYFSFTLNGAPVADSEIVKSADVINLHWVEKFISNRSLAQLAALGKPLVWTLHDQRPFTGGCHYASGCTGFIDSCHDCRQLLRDPHHLPQRVLNERLSILGDMNLTIVAPSNWLAGEARKSRLFRDKPIRVIANSIDTDLFFPSSKPAAKAQVDIGAEVVTLMFGAQHNRERRKGLEELMESLEICLRDKKFRDACEGGAIQVISIGDRGSDISRLPIRSNNFGYIEDDQKLATLYSATDLFIIPSLEDNLPNSLLEAMACGTPVAAFATGGIPDLLENRINGALVDKGDTAAFAEAILDLVFNERKRSVFGARSRSLIEARFRQRIQAGKYCELFEDLLAQRASSSASHSPTVHENRIYVEALRAAMNGPLSPDMRTLAQSMRERLSRGKCYFRNKYSRFKRLMRS
jgi:glycosyltransferase involved in cell wall biosynthesis